MIPHPLISHSVLLGAAGGRWRRTAVSLALVLAWALGPALVPVAGAGPGTVVRIGSGAARLTVAANGSATLYVNLKGLAPGRWNEHLWSGTCSDLGTRVAVLPGLVVPASGNIARTNVLTASQVGRSLRLVNGSRVLCASFASTSTPDAVLVGAGDIAGCGFSADNATGRLIEDIPGTVFTAGDNVYPDGTTTEFADCYSDAWGSFKSRTLPVPGNHDYNTPGAAGYFDYFGAAAGKPGEGWYATNVGAWRIYSLNSNCWAIGGCGAGSAEERWLRADLAANPHACVAAIWHHPRFSSGEHSSDPMTGALWQALYDANAELVISGHDHDYERFAPMNPDGAADPARGIRQFVVGTGGVGLNTFPAVQPNSIVRSNGAFGVLKLTLRDRRFAWEFIPIVGQVFSDSGEGTCH